MQESLESIPDKVITVLHTFGKLIIYLEGWETIQQVAGTARHTEQFPSEACSDSLMRSSDLTILTLQKEILISPCLENSKTSSPR